MICVPIPKDKVADTPESIRDAIAASISDLKYRIGQFEHKKYEFVPPAIGYSAAAVAHALVQAYHEPNGYTLNNLSQIIDNFLQAEEAAK